MGERRARKKGSCLLLITASVRLSASGILVSRRQTAAGAGGASAAMKAMRAHSQDHEDGDWPGRLTAAD